MNFISDVSGHGSRLSVTGDPTGVVNPAFNNALLIARPWTNSERPRRLTDRYSGAPRGSFTNVVWGYEPRK